MTAPGDRTARSPRDRDLEQVRARFAPALESDEVLVAALAATPYPQTAGHIVAGTVKNLAGRNQGRVLLLTDRAIHVAGRHLWRSRFRVLLATYPVGSVPIRYASGELWIAGVSYFLNPVGFQLGGTLGSARDVERFVAAGYRP